MSVGLIIAAGLVAWSLGPLMLRIAGTLLLVIALLAWVLPAAPQTSVTTLAGTAISGALMRYAGTIWGARRTSPGPPQRVRRR
jgi:hypothetical protein